MAASLRSQPHKFSLEALLHFLDERKSISLLLSAGLVMDILSTFCDGFMIQCVKLMLSKFLHLWFFYCLTVLCPAIM